MCTKSRTGWYAGRSVQIGNRILRYTRQFHSCLDNFIGGRLLCEICGVLMLAARPFRVWRSNNQCASAMRAVYRCCATANEKKGKWFRQFYWFALNLAIDHIIPIANRESGLASRQLPVRTIWMRCIYGGWWWWTSFWWRLKIEHLMRHYDVFG